MSFYLKPPRGFINLYKLEECVLQRIQCYNNIYKNNQVEASNFEYLVEDSALDRTGHFIFRLAAYSNASFAQIFTQYDCNLLKVRLNCYNPKDIRYFIKKLLNQSKESLKCNGISITLGDFYITLTRICLLMLRKDYNDHVFVNEHFECDNCELYNLKVPFYHCASLVSTREVILQNGYALIFCMQWKELLLSLFEIYLEIVLKEMKYSQSVQAILQDTRIKTVLTLVQNNNYYHEGETSSTFDLNNIDTESKFFPLCMQNLYTVLKKTNRLPHNPRFDFSLYLKGIGVSMSDSIKFWQSFYSKEHTSCSKCTHNWQKDEKRYIYGIRHLYGLAGSRKNYSVRSCNYLQEMTLGPSDEGGCPFKHFDDHSLRTTLKQLLPNSDDEIEVMIYERQENPKESCRLFYKNVLQILNNEQNDKEIDFHNPVQYFKSFKL